MRREQEVEIDLAIAQRRESDLPESAEVHLDRIALGDATGTGGERESPARERQVQAGRTAHRAYTEGTPGWPWPRRWRRVPVGAPMT